MVAVNHDYPSSDANNAALDEDLLVKVADLRARGKSWEEVARAVERGVDALREALRRDPNFAPALKRARREVLDEANDEGLARLRKLTECDKPRVALDAHKVITRYLAEKDRNRTRLEIERMRLRAAADRGAKAEQGAPTQDEHEEGGDPEAEEIARRAKEVRERRERLEAERVAREEAVVYLWGGCHKIGDTPPDETDTPVYLTADHTVRGRVLYWALCRPFPTNPSEGPFLKPDQCKRPGAAPPTSAEPPAS